MLFCCRESPGPAALRYTPPPRLWTEARAPVFIAAPTLFILKTLLFLRPVAAAASKFLLLCVFASFSPSGAAFSQAQTRLVFLELNRHLQIFPNFPSRPKKTESSFSLPSLEKARRRSLFERLIIHPQNWTKETAKRRRRGHRTRQPRRE